MGEWLQTETSEIRHLLQILCCLWTYLRQPGLLEGTYVNDEGDEVELTKEQYEELGGLSHT